MSSDFAPIWFRFDDISVNTPGRELTQLCEVITHYAPDSRLLLAVSSIVFSAEQLGTSQATRVHPSRLTAMSALTPYYKGTCAGVPEYVGVKEILGLPVQWAGHGLLHVDHRLLNHQAQEMSIVTSCALARGTYFVPPYNKWNAETERICFEHDLTLVKFEDGWNHVRHNRWAPSGRRRYYLHTYDIEHPDQLAKWFQGGSL